MREITHPTDGFEVACLRLASDASGGSILERANRGQWGLMGRVGGFLGAARLVSMCRGHRVPVAAPRVRIVG